MPRSRVAAATLALVLTGTACSTGASKGTDTNGQTLTLAVAADVSTWDPAVGAGGNSLGYLQAVYSSLTTLNPADFTIAPGLATAWSYDPPKTTLTLTLRDGITFSDGTPLDAEAVRANLQRGLTTPGATQSVLAAIKTIEATGPNEVRITLKKPDPGLLYQLSMVPGMIASPKAFATLKTDPVGSGPYVLDLKATTRGTSYTFVRNPTYSLPAKYAFSRLVMKALPDTNAMVNAALSGQVDAGGVPGATLPQVESGGLAYRKMPGLILGMWIVDRAGKLAPPLAELKVRQAINHGLDAEGILKAVDKGNGSRRAQMFAAGTPGYVESLNSRYPYDPAKAKKLLAEAGYPDGFELTLPSENTYLPALYPIVAQQLGQIGIKVKYKPVSSNLITQQYLAGTYPAFMYTYTSTENWLDASLFLAKGGVFNPFHTADPTVERLMDKIAVAEDAERGPLFQELNTYAVEQAWFAPLYASTNLMVWKKDKVKVETGDDQLFVVLSDYKPVT
ncbi:ABC transporter substrate-binding protein [Nonomuraea typhae]|uniref:ABC transporter substrate-binding protein n=1 Tax=Nonomuraea typhae TaxID=2603600 RepID=UPI0012FB887D|nr:ABC transporter substrate-binding protein [Nonomuraea typhae]